MTRHSAATNVLPLQLEDGPPQRSGRRARVESNGAWHAVICGEGYLIAREIQNPTEARGLAAFCDELGEADGMTATAKIRPLAMLSAGFALYERLGNSSADWMNVGIAAHDLLGGTFVMGWNGTRFSYCDSFRKLAAQWPDVLNEAVAVLLAITGREMVEGDPHCRSCRRDWFERILMIERAMADDLLTRFEKETAALAKLKARLGKQTAAVARIEAELAQMDA